ncbi:hypothetical protein YC2023_093825 [Brassica napus]
MARLDKVKNISSWAQGSADNSSYLEGRWRPNYLQNNLEERPKGKGHCFLVLLSTPELNGGKNEKWYNESGKHDVLANPQYIKLKPNNLLQRPS